MSMQDVLGSVDGLIFDVEVALDSQLGSLPLPFPGMDKSNSAICTFYLQNACDRGQLCPFRHVIGEKSVVCKHWLRGLCKKGDQCEFLHQYDLAKMPECFFFSKYNACSNKECPFRHIDPESRIKDCAWYDRGFCRNGPLCKNRHRRRVMCVSYMNGFCKDGPKCKFFHPRFELPKIDPKYPYAGGSAMGVVVCHHCGETGHKITVCPKLLAQSGGSGGSGSMEQRQKPLSEVTCYKCGEKGHYANKCSKGFLAFLSQSAHMTQEIRQRDEQQQKHYQQQMNQRRAGEMQR